MRKHHSRHLGACRDLGLKYHFGRCWRCHAAFTSLAPKRTKPSDGFDIVLQSTGTRVELGNFYFAYRPASFTRACSVVKTSVRNFVQEALGNVNASDADSYIDQLYRETGVIDRVRDQGLNVLLAGQDTTAATLSYVFYLLTRHSVCLKKLRLKVERVLGEDGKITRSLLQHMPYLHQIIKETLRLCPPVPNNSRFCKQTPVLPRGGGLNGQAPLLVRKNMPIAYSVYHMHRREDLYGKDALEFRPERWDGPELAHIGGAYLPFNTGPRVCLGSTYRPKGLIKYL